MAKTSATMGIVAVCAVALVGAAMGKGLDRSKFHIGCFSFNAPAQTPKHIAEARACGLDYVGGGIDATNRLVMEAFSENGLAVNCTRLPRICGSHPARGTEALRQKLPRERLERSLEEFNATYRHPAIAMMNICDEPPDCADEKRAEHVVEFSAYGRVVAFGPDGSREVVSCGEGRCRLTLVDNSCALVLLEKGEG